MPVKKSVFPDFIVCLKDGKNLKMLKRYIETRYGITPDNYREKWNLPRDYPMVSPDYAVRRSMLAKQINFGRKASVETVKPKMIEADEFKVAVTKARWARGSKD